MPPPLGASGIVHMLVNEAFLEENSASMRATLDAQPARASAANGPMGGGGGRWRKGLRLLHARENEPKDAKLAKKGNLGVVCLPRK